MEGDCCLPRHVLTLGPVNRQPRVDNLELTVVCLVTKSLKFIHLYK